MNIPVVIVDDQASVRQMLAQVLSQEGSYQIVGEGRTGFEGLDLCERMKPRLLIVDLALPEMSGAELVQKIRETMREVRVLIYTGAQHRGLILSALRARPHGFVHKRDSLAVFHAALTAVSNGCSYLTPFAMGLMDEAPNSGSDPEKLTGRERVVLQMVAEGLSSKEVAYRLSISPKTVDHHRGQLMRKLGLRDVAGITRFAVRCGLVSLD